MRTFIIFSLSILLSFYSKAENASETQSAAIKLGLQELCSVVEQAIDCRRADVSQALARALLTGESTSKNNLSECHKDMLANYDETTSRIADRISSLSDLKEVAYQALNIAFFFIKSKNDLKQCKANYTSFDRLDCYNKAIDDSDKEFQDNLCPNRTKSS